jgi:hypothetical protein
MRRTALKRKTPLKRGRKKVYGTAPEWRRFKQLVVELDGGCVMRFVHECDGELQACHVIPKQALKRRGWSDLIWLPESAFCGCERAHRRSDSGRERVPRSLLPARCIRFAKGLGLSHLIDRLYGEDPTPKKEKDQSA